jgi:tellurite resistance protein TerC
MTLQTCLWPSFLALVALILFIDLFVLHRHSRVISLREASCTVGAYISLAAIFAIGVFAVAGTQRGAEFVTAYLVEQALSLDNIFVIALIFSYFSVPAEAQHRVLFYGIIGAIVMRLSLIVPGVHLLDRFHVIAYALGALLIYSGIKMVRADEDMIDPGESWVVRKLRKHARCTGGYDGARFLVKRDGVRWITPLFVVLVTVEITDLIFAVDSIPAVLALSDNAFIVFSSNVFAIMGLRALFFVLAGMMREFRYLKTGLSLVLMFIGAKMMLSGMVEIPSELALGVTAFLIGGSIVASIITRAENPASR